MKDMVNVFCDYKPSCLQQYYRIQPTMTYLNLFSLFSSGVENLEELVSAVMQRIGAANHRDRPHILVKPSWAIFAGIWFYYAVKTSDCVYFSNFFHQFEDDEGDRVLLATDDDLVSAVSHARGVGLKVLQTLFHCFIYFISNTFVFYFWAFCTIVVLQTLDSRSPCLISNRWTF